MDIQEIEVFIDAEGKVRLHVRGVSGSGCLDITRALEAALGGQVTSREMTPEAYEAVALDAMEHQPQRGA